MMTLRQVLRQAQEEPQMTSLRDLPLVSSLSRGQDDIMKKNLFMFPLLLLSLSIPSLAMKRETGKPEGQEEPMEQPRKKPKVEEQEEKSAFEALPAEIKVYILKLLVHAPGFSKMAKLHNAADNIRNFMMTNKEMHAILEDQLITGYLIHELARRYTNGDLMSAILALHTNSAGIWMRNHENDFRKNIILEIVRAVEKNYMPEFLFIIRHLPHFVNAFDVHHRSLLYIAAQNNYSAIVEKLLSLPGINVNQANRSGQTPLMAANEKGNLAITERLLAMPNINVNAQSEKGSTALAFAAAAGQLAVVERLLRVPGIQVNLANNHGVPPLMHAAKAGHHEIVNRLLQMPGIDINRQETLHSGSALMAAAYYGHLPIVQRLLQMPGIQINVRSNNGRTALNQAMRSTSPNKQAIIKLLKEHGAIE
jgi:ankyrin repeat protein